MRKVILSMMVSIDGYMESTDPTENWFVWSDEMSAYMMDFFKTTDTFIYGRKSYEGMIQYWPQLSGGLADVMNPTPKLVFSRTLKEAVWNTTIVKENPSEVIPILKQEKGKDMALFAGRDLAAAFINSNLVDEYRFIINPVILGGGKLLFKDVNIRQDLRHIQTIPFSCGSIIVVYHPL